MTVVSVTPTSDQPMLEIRKTSNRESIAAISGLSERLSPSILHLWQIANRPTTPRIGRALVM